MQEQQQAELKHHLFAVVYNKGVELFQAKQYPRACKMFQAALQFSEAEDKARTLRTLACFSLHRIICSTIIPCHNHLANSIIAVEPTCHILCY